MNVKPGCVYLALGTGQEVQWLLRQQGLGDIPQRNLYHPTTNELRQQLEGFSWDDSPEVYIIYPSQLSGTGRYGVKGSLLKKGGKEPTDASLPTDQFFNVAEHRYVFIIAADITGTTTAELKSAAKSVEGGAYILLDLKNMDYGIDTTEEWLAEYKGYPYTLQQQLEIGVVGEARTHDYPNERRIIRNLTTADGALRWGAFTKTELVRWFITPNVKGSFLLMRGKAGSLEPYISPCLDAVRESLSSAPLQRFALWIYYSSTYWSETGNVGLHEYTTTRRGVQDKCWFFNPSTKARSHYLNMINGVLH